MDRQQYRLITFIVAVVLASVYFFIFSKSGYLERLNLQEGRRQMANKIELLKSEKKIYQNILQRYKEGKVSDNDLLGSGYIRPGDRIILFKNSIEKRSLKTKEKASETGFFAHLVYVRATWIAFSAVVLACLVIYGRWRNNKEPSNFE